MTYELRIDNYRIEQCVTENKRPGGVMALVHEGISYKVRISKCVQNFVWFLTVEMLAQRKMRDLWNIFGRTSG